MNPLLQTKLMPPRQPRHVLARPGLHARLLDALEYRVTVVQASTGYGKTTALASLDAGEVPYLWYSVEEADRDPQRFLAYLVAACRHRLPALSDGPLAVLQERGALTEALDALLNALVQALDGPTLLVVDDFHFVADVPEVAALVERLVAFLPPDLHLVLATRYPLALPGLLRWRARGEVLNVDRTALAFRPAEIDALFRDRFDVALAPDEVRALADATEGWPIALGLVWQRLRSSRPARVTDLLAQRPTSLAALFDYLAGDVFAGQPPSLARFLRETAVLRELTPAACQAVTGDPQSAAHLARLRERDLFLVELGPDLYRYHHLFHDFLRQQAAADPDAVRTRHRRAAAYFRDAGRDEETIFHALAAADYGAAARAVERVAGATLRAGRLDTVAGWIDALPAPVLAAHPRLQAYLGDLYRLRSRFDEALAWYRQAERSWRAERDAAGVSRALRGQALVFLDTVRPAEAESLLEEALRLIDGVEDRHARARLLDLMAENKLNLGKPDAAEALRAEARALREDVPGEDALSVRVKLRTGRLDEAQRLLEAWVEAERREAEHGQRHPPRAHRESVLILSLIHAFRGEADRAFALAQEGVALGEGMHSPFVTAVAQMRLGHAWQLQGRYGDLASQRHARDQAIRCYERAIALGDELAVRRTRVEALWGLTRAHGYAGELEAAERAAAEGVEIGQRAGDQWIVALVELALGASYVRAGRLDEAIELLNRVLVAFRDCGDRFGRAATRLWLSLAYHAAGQPARFATCIERGLTLVDDAGYSFLWLRPTLLGTPDVPRLVPLLLDARARRLRPAMAEQLLHALGLAAVEVHPGFSLRVQTLGAFRVWRGEAEVEPRDWQRDKARQLFQLLLVHRDRWMQRDELVEQLWPDLAPDAATRDFKVALNALNKALEPGRAPGAPYAFVVRDGTAYRLRPEADLRLDAERFEATCTAALADADAAPCDAVAALEASLALYAGDFLPDALYEAWAHASRERLRALFLQGATRLAEALLGCERYDECLAWCRRLLVQDPCWEAAYRLQMHALLAQGHRSLALRAYARCAEVLEAELGVPPSSITLALYQQVASGDREAGGSEHGG